MLPKLGAGVIREPSCERPPLCDPRIGDIVDAIWAGQTPDTEWMRTVQAVAAIQTHQRPPTTLLSAKPTSPARAQRTPPAVATRLSPGGVREHELGGGRRRAGGRTRRPIIFNARPGAAEHLRVRGSPMPGGGSPARTVSVTPTAAPSSAGSSMQSPQAVAQNRGGILQGGSEAPEPNFDLPEKGPDLRIACYPGCAPDPRAAFPPGPLGDAQYQAYLQGTKVSGMELLLAAGSQIAANTEELVGRMLAKFAPGHASRLGIQAAGRSTAEILSETFGKRLPGSPLERSLEVLEQIKQGTFKPPADLTLEHLDYYEKVAKQAIEAGKDTTGVQSVRLQIVQALRGLLR